MLDGELSGRKPTKRLHSQVVGVMVMKNKMLFEICKGAKAVAEINPFLILAAAALHFSSVPGDARGR